ncbi:hypothetical protein MPTK1_1g10490 [Marchantia polymorpha subsp. ruderalis]|uniref:DUF599 domain-containing protein n=2 Tax=Marchantia polymorpha TaxID=3197 RepID=A0A176WF61_MARPO|nr:hypothetical protein AXG93_2018s1490 [Marchantia polymorpha subsp. ruderalis]PTQ45668.1 hypothetical protein MARPO_0014s0178 [Marchantia polymorpha]BBM98058.1 hypothetical protein Mp_1g10490 [Marchantia polymorpha subsp. ruderalis]|eukprot:PTQ45668.1 hypothetical protein MARPO_0014s0178 [Marchantia polymorpha]
MGWRESYLDAILVPLGLILMFAYHAHLYYKIRTSPLDTVIAINHLNRRAWVHNIMSDSKANGILAVQTIRNSIMASTLLAGTAITLSSLIGALVAGSSTTYNSVIVVGAFGSTILAVKYLSILCCFLAAFVCHVQAIRYSSHVSFLITVPVGEMAPGLSAEYVNRMIYRSSNFFSLGLRCYYLSFPLLLWLFGPIPMFVCCLLIVSLLNIVDTAKDFKLTLHHSEHGVIEPRKEDKKSTYTDEMRRKDEEAMD